MPNERRAKAILWDLDGVIVDSAPYHLAAYQWLLAQRGVELTAEYFRTRLFGRRNWDILQDVLGPLSDAEVHALADQKEAKFRELVRGHITPLPGAVGLLRRAHEAGIRQSIVSSTPRANIQLIVETLRIGAYLDEIGGEEDSERGKPDPQPFTTAADRLGMPYDRCVVIEDAPEGIEAGKASGMRVIGVATTRPSERLTRAGADLVVESLADDRVWAFVSGG